MWLLSAQGSEDYPNVLINIETGAVLCLKKQGNSGTISLLPPCSGKIDPSDYGMPIQQFDDYTIAAQAFKALAVKLKARDVSSPALEEIEL